MKTRKFSRDFTVIGNEKYRDRVPAAYIPLDECLKIKWLCQSLGYHAVEDDFEKPKFIHVTSIQNPLLNGWIAAGVEEHDEDQKLTFFFGYRDIRDNSFKYQYSIHDQLKSHLILSSIQCMDHNDSFTDEQIEEMELRRRIPSLEPKPMRIAINNLRHAI